MRVSYTIDNRPISYSNLNLQHHVLYSAMLVFYFPSDLKLQSQQVLPNQSTALHCSSFLSFSSRPSLPREFSIRRDDGADRGGEISPLLCALFLIESHYDGARVVGCAAHEGSTQQRL